MAVVSGFEADSESGKCKNKLGHSCEHGVSGLNPCVFSAFCVPAEDGGNVCARWVENCTEYKSDN